MLRKSLLTGVFCIVSAVSTSAEEYVVKFEDMRYPIIGKTHEKGEAETLATIEVLCRPGEQAHGRVTFGRVTLELNVSISSVNDDQVAMEVKYRHLQDTGKTYLDNKANPQNLIAQSKKETQITVRNHDSLKLDGLLVCGPSGRFQEACVISVEEHKPGTELSPSE